MELVTIDAKGHRATREAAASIARMRAAGMPDGGVTSAYRSDAEQAELRALWEAGKGNYALRAGQSVHRTGRAVDWKVPQYLWLEQHGAEHGWHNPTRAPNYERWHYEHVSADDRHRNDPTPTKTVTVEEDQEDTMIRLARIKGTKAVYAGDGITRRLVKDNTELADIQWRINQGQFKGSATVEDVDRLDWLGKLVK